MKRVIIADDEPRVCQLIIKLVDWDRLQMEVVGVANNGIDALALIGEKQPHIAITDIRMPGLNGLDLIKEAKDIKPDLEFIIISGYQEFSYAQKAIQYGVRDYLCKPINKSELETALTRIEERALQGSEPAAIPRDLEKIRVSFFKNVIFSKIDLDNYSLDQINRSYYFTLRPGLFQMVMIKIDGANHSWKTNQTITELVEKLRTSLAKLTYDVEFVYRGSYLYVLLNFTQAQEGEINVVFDQLLIEFQNRLRLVGLTITIGFGRQVSNVIELLASIETAQIAIENRILKGTGRILTFTECDPPVLGEEEWYYRFTQSFTQAVQTINLQACREALDEWQLQVNAAIKEGRLACGSHLKYLAEEVIDLYYVTVRNSKIRLSQADTEQQQLKNKIDDCYSFELLLQQLSKGIIRSLTRLASEALEQEHVLVRRAKSYINEHYMEKITLDELGAELGFNPSYFSTLFKKEAGISFMDYLIQIRLEKAKELLKEPDLKIQDVSFMVGYNDVRYFRKLFTDSTGLTPTEFRRVFG